MWVSCEAGGADARTSKKQLTLRPLEMKLGGAEGDRTPDLMTASSN